MLEEVYLSYRNLAEEIDWKSYNQNDLFFKYIKHENDSLADKFYAGIVCRYWGYTGKLYLQCNKHVSFDQCYDTLLDTIDYVLKKRVWENPESSLYNDKTAPDKAFHIVLKRQRGILLASLSTAKRKANFNALSLDSLYEDYKDASEGLFGLVDDTSEGTLKIISYISTRKDTLEKIILHCICFEPWKTIESIARLVKTFDSQEYVMNTYDITEHDYLLCKKRIDDMSIRLLVVNIKKLLFLLKSEWE